MHRWTWERGADGVRGEGWDDVKPGNRGLPRTGSDSNPQKSHALRIDELIAG